VGGGGGGGKGREISVISFPDSGLGKDFFAGREEEGCKVLVELVHIKTDGTSTRRGRVVV